MIFDATNLFSSAQAVTSTALSTNVIDLGAPGRVYGNLVDMSRDIGKGKPIPILIKVVVPMVDADGSPTLTVTLESDSAEGLNSSPVVHWTSGAIPEASLVAGYEFLIDFVPTKTTGRYLGLRYTVASGAFDTGNITAGIVAGRQTNA